MKQNSSTHSRAATANILHVWLLLLSHPYPAFNKRHYPVQV